MAVPPQLIIAAAQMLKNRKSNKDRIKEALAPATDVLKNDIMPLVGMGADAGMMYNLRAEDPSMRTGIATGAIGSAAKGFQANGIKGLITGGVMGGLTGAIATGNAKEQKAEQDKYTYLNQMYSSVVGADNNLQSALMYAEDGGEIVSAEGEVFVPIQTEAKMVGKKLVKEKFIFSDGKIADVNATKPHSEQKKDAVTDITVEGTYVMPVSTKLSKKDLDSLVSYSTSNYSENGKNFAVEKVTLRDILGEKFEGSFAEATDIIVKKYPVMDSDDDLDPIARITNNENIANRSKIIAHLMRLNEAKINKQPIEEVKLTPSMKAKKGSFISKYVLKPKMSLKKGGYIRKMAVGGGVGDPPGKKYKSANGTMIVGEDGKYYFGKKDGSYIEANPQTVQMFKNQLDGSKKPSGGDNPWLLVENTTSKKNSSTNGKDTEWISQILDFESKSGSASGTGLKNYGIQRDKWGKKYKYLDKDEISREDATRFIEEEYLHKVKDYPPDVQKRLVDYAYNTGRNIEDVLMHASGLVDTQSVQTKNTDYELFEKNKDQIIKNMQDPNFISKIDQSKHDILKDYWGRKGNSSAYKDTSAKRIDMWTNRENTKVEPIDSKKLDPIYSMESMDILGTPKNTPNTPISPNVTQSSTDNTTGVKWGGDYLVQKANNWDQNTPTEERGYMGKIDRGGSTNTIATDKKDVTTNSIGNKYNPKGAYYIPGENKNRYDKDEQGNWYIQKDDGKTWVTASSLPNSAEAIKRLNDEAKERSTMQNNKPTVSSSLVKPKTNKYKTPITPVAPTSPAKQASAPLPENWDPNADLRDIQYSGLIQQTYNDFNKELLTDGFKNQSDKDIDYTVNYGKNHPDVYVTSNEKLYLKKSQEEKLRRDKLKSLYLYRDPGIKVYAKPAKMKKGGYIRKMYAGGPIVPMPIYPNPNTGIYAMYNPGDEYTEITNTLPSPYDSNWNPINPNTIIPPSTNTTQNNNSVGTTTTSPNNQTPTTTDTDVLDIYKNKITERKGDTVRDAEEAKTGYKALSKRVGMRDLMQLGTGLVGIGLQDRTEKRAFKRPLYIDQKYRGLSAQQINQQAEASSGAGVEAIKQMMNSGGDRMTSRLAPILLDKIMSQQGQTRKSYVDQNQALERAKYGERGMIQQFNLDEESRAQNLERDYNNKAISGTSSLINKYISSRSEGDIKDFATSRGIDQDLTNKLYALDNQEMQVDMIGKDYDMQMSEINQKIADIEAELSNPNTNLDETAKTSLKSYQESYKKIAKELEKRKIRQNINGK